MSKFLTLNWRDFLKGFVISVLAPVILIIQQSLDSGELVFNWKQIGMAALAAGVAYLLKNLVTNSDDKILKKDEEPIIGNRPGDR